MLKVASYSILKYYRTYVRSSIYRLSENSCRKGLITVPVVHLISQTQYRSEARKLSKFRPASTADTVS